VKKRRETKEVVSEARGRKELSMRGLFIDVDIEGKVLRKRFVHADGTEQELDLN
jgi:hypothetical protein